MTIGTHLASLNLFRESDGTVEITVAGHSPALMTEHARNLDRVERPVEYIERLIIEAADRIRSRRTRNGLGDDI